MKKSSLEYSGHRTDDQETFSGRIVEWQKRFGRNDLPWQNTRDPYRVWVSEIMLQQTQVSTVIAYYTRFLDRFPDVQSLAAAKLDDVFGLWSGLGYYTRARNLHACAVEVMQKHSGAFPQNAAELALLPGIGPSTAAAIASICFHERAAIFDANVKRVMARYLGFADDLSSARNEKNLHAKVLSLLPQSTNTSRIPCSDMPRHTQALMDLGALVCTVRNPQCSQCPVQVGCVAFKEGKTAIYPVRTRKLKRSSQSLWLMILGREDGAIWLYPRSEKGIWSGLYCPAIFENEEQLKKLLPEANLAHVQELDSFVHVLTHRDLHLHPWLLAVDLKDARQLDDSLAQIFSQGRWFSSDAWNHLGLPAPIRKLLMRQVHGDASKSSTDSQSALQAAQR